MDTREIQQAQIEAAEDLVVAGLRRKGLLPPDPAVERTRFIRMKVKNQVAEEKLREWTDPNAPLPAGFTGSCVSCGVHENYTYHVPENLWRVVIPERWWSEIVCAACFHVLASARARLEREVVGAAKAWRNLSDAYPLRGDFVEKESWVRNRDVLFDRLYEAIDALEKFEAGNKTNGS